VELLVLLVWVLHLVGPTVRSPLLVLVDLALLWMVVSAQAWLLLAPRAVVLAFAPKAGYW
jgi:hypothetical protein